MKIEIRAKVKRRNFTLDVDLAIEEPMAGLFGPSGSGKTTLVHLLAGLLKSGDCRLMLDGEVIQDSAARIFIPPHQRRVGVVFQEGRLFPHLDVRRNLEYGYRCIPPELRRFQPEEIAELLEIVPLLERWPRQLSGGEGQRVALGRSILASPRLLLLDEPMASLDNRLRRQITPLLRQIRDVTQIPMIYVSHNLQDVLELTEYFIALDNGHLLGQGRLSKLKQNPRFNELL